MPMYHDAFWLAVTTSSVVLTMGCLVLVSTRRRSSTSEASTMLAIAVVFGLAVTFAIGMTCLGLRRDFVRPLAMSIVMSLAFMCVMGLVGARAVEDSPGRVSK
jgi:hypothetical protein